MIIKCILLALSASVDALSLGLTYGIKKTHMSKLANIIIFIIVFCSSSISILLGHYISLLFSPTISSVLGAALLILLGIYNLYKSKNNCSTNFDKDNSNFIDNQESIFLGFAVAIDASCVSLSSGIIGYGSFILPIFMGVLHIFFVNCGNIVASSIIKKINISDKTLSTFSGILLILIGVTRLFS